MKAIKILFPTWYQLFVMSVRMWASKYITFVAIFMKISEMLARNKPNNSIRKWRLWKTGTKDGLTLWWWETIVVIYNKILLLLNICGARRSVNSFIEFSTKNRTCIFNSQFLFVICFTLLCTIYWFIDLLCTQYFYSWTILLWIKLGLVRKLDLMEKN